MKFMLLLYVPTEIRDDPNARASMQEWMAYGRALTDAGAHLGDNALEGLETATTVRVRDGETLVSDGPFAETKEMLGGYYVIDVPDREAAVAWAAKVPNAPYGTIEIRPVMDFDAP
ncbi:MAG: YciI family protein [Conexibacter sp.]|nr:YciI family protein [Conexibacter sp.]